MILEPGNQGGYYQIGYWRYPPLSCPRWFTQYWWPTGPNSQVFETDESGFCAANQTWYTLVIRHEVNQPASYWRAYVLTSDNQNYVWQAQNQPHDIFFSAEDSQFATETHNWNDQAGGSNSLPMYLDSVYRWDANYNVRYVNWTGTERYCHRSLEEEPYGPYRCSWPDGDTLKVWTVGY